MDTKTAIGEMFNKFTIKDVIDIAKKAWNDCQESFIAKSWHQLIILSNKEVVKHVNAQDLQEQELEPEPEPIFQSKP